MSTFPWTTFVRAILKIGGGYFFGKGWYQDDSSLEALAAGTAAIIGVVWGYLEKRWHQRKLAEAEAKLQELADKTPSI